MLFQIIYLKVTVSVPQTIIIWFIFSCHKMLVGTLLYVK